MCNYISRSVMRGKVRKVYSRGTIIPELYIGKTVKVHMGNRFVGLYVTKDMVGYKLGDYVVTKKMGSEIHKRKKKKGKKKMKKKRG